MEEISTHALTGTIDFGIVTIREDEFEAALRFFVPKRIARDGRRTYNIAEFSTLNGMVYRAAVVRSHEQGHAAAQSATSDIINDLAPTWIVLVGIAGAVPEFEFSLGDVVVATRLHDFSVTAAVADGTTEWAAKGGPSHKVIQDLASNLPAIKQQLGNWNSQETLAMTAPPVTIDDSNFSGDTTWKQKLHAVLTARFSHVDAGEYVPRVTAQAVASGNLLMKNSDLLNEWLIHARDLKAVEMELGGVYEAARDKTGDTPILAIRGISDVVGFKRDSRWTAYACETAAAFAYALLRTGPVSALSVHPQPSQPPQESSAVLRGGDAFGSGGAGGGAAGGGAGGTAYGTGGGGGGGSGGPSGGGGGGGGGEGGQGGDGGIGAGGGGGGKGAAGGNGGPGQIIITYTPIENPPPPKTLFDLYQLDAYQSHVVVGRLTWKNADGTAQEIESILSAHVDSSKSNLWFFVPNSVDTGPAVDRILASYENQLSELEKHISGCTFSGCVFAYYEGNLSVAEAAVFRERFTRAGLSLELRGVDYFKARHP